MDPNQIPGQPGQNKTKSDENITQQGQNPSQLDQGTTTNQPEVQPQTQGQMPQPSQTLPQAQAPQPSQSGPQPEMAQQMEAQPSQPPKGGISKHTLMLIIFLIVAVILALIIYLMLFNRQPAPPPPVLPPSVPTVTVTPVQLTDEEELDRIDVGNIDADLQEIEADLENL